MPSFKQLWDKHPTITGDDEPCTTNGKSNFPNQCAIRLGVCLARCGVETSKIPGAEHCWFHAKTEGHVLRAEQLAKGLAKFEIGGAKKRISVEPKKLGQDLDGKTGIIFLKDYWRRSGETQQNRSGDHIDLWNRSRLTDWTTWFRIQWGLTIEDVWSDFQESREIWFWPVD